MKRRVVAGRAVEKLSELRNILRFQRVAPCAEEVKRLTVHKKDCFLTFMDNELSQRVKILARMLPHKGAVISLVFDDIN